MKPELAILPLEVWADVSEHPLITRQMLAQIADNNGDPDFTNKLQKLLHECGKHSLRYLNLSSKQSDKTTQEQKIEPKCRAVLAVSPNSRVLSTYNECEFPETEMPENIKTFKDLLISYLDDQVLNFLEKIKPLFTNVYLVIMESTEDVRTLFGHLLPMITSIREIKCEADCIEFLEREFPGTLALAKELELVFPEMALIPVPISTYLNWLTAPQDFDVHGPRFLRMYTNWDTISDIIDAVRKQFLEAATPSTFVIFLKFFQQKPEDRAEEFTIKNTTTKEELIVQNFEKPNESNKYVKILRHPAGANAKLQEWIKKRAFYEKEFNCVGEDAERVIWGHSPRIGQITKKAKSMKQDENESVEDKDKAGPSTSTAAKKMDK